MLNYAKDQKSTDSPLFQLLKEADPPNFDKLQAEIFGDRMMENKKLKEKLRMAGNREDAKEALLKIESGMGDIREKEADVLMDLLRSYRAISAHSAMLKLIDRMDPILAESAMVQEQKAFALNRLGRREEAKTILADQLKKNGPDSETYGLLGRVYKDWWQDALKAGDTFLAESYLDQAIECYQKGFEADWRDFYPGVNAVTLMEVRGETTEIQRRLMEVVRYAVERKVAAGHPGYWDYATLLEISVLLKDKSAARQAITKAIHLIDESWMAKSTAENLAMIRKAREARGEEALPWAEEMENYLMR
jgi:tetratricopeptide (TPR) repeat protein